MSKSHISENAVKHIADLVELDINGQEKKYAEMLSETIDYIEILDGLDTQEVGMTYHVTGLKNVFQDTEAKNQTLTQKEALSNSENNEKGLFVTEGVFDR